MSGFKIGTGQKIVLIGDSITDCGRRIEFPPLGSGYVSIAADLVTIEYLDQKIEWINRGISGDVVQGLVGRWTEDVIDEKPDWVSVAIGINDIYREQLSGKKLEDSLKDFKNSYRYILERTKKETAAKIILFETFYVQKEDQLKYGLEVDPYNKIVHRLASDYSAIMVPVQLAFENTEPKGPLQYWTTGDGIHPSPEGHRLIALTFLKSMGF